VKVALRLLGCQPVPPWVVSPQVVITKENASLSQSTTETALDCSAGRL